LAFDDINESIPKINIVFKAIFSFTGVEKLEDIPDFFYRNALAIVFPYIRSFVSTLTLQSNSKLIILPTMNLSKLEKPLREKTSTI
jgi:preprotein translocase subunit SecB